MPEDIHSLYKTHGPTVLRRCRRLLRDERRAVEAMHEVLAHMVATIDTSPAPVTASQALILATQTCLDHIRAQARAPRDPEDELLIRIAALPAGPRPSPWLPSRLLARLLTRRQRQQRLIAVLATLDRLSPEEIAQELGLPESHVHQTLHHLAQRWPEIPMQV